MSAKKTLKWIASNFMELVAGTAISACILMTTVNALTRYILRWTWNPSTDLNTLFFAYIVFCGAAAAYKRKMHFGIDLVISKLPDNVKKFAVIPIHLLVLFILAVAFYYSIDLASRVGGKVLLNTKISYFWYDLSAILGFFFMFVYELIDTIKDVKLLFSKKEVAE